MYDIFLSRNYCNRQNEPQKGSLSYECCRLIMYLLYKSGFKSNQHKKSEDTVIPVLIKTPQPNAKHLKDKERSGSSFFEQLPKFRDIHLKPEKTMFEKK